MTPARGMALELLLLEERLQMRVADGAFGGGHGIVDPVLAAAARLTMK